MLIIVEGPDGVGKSTLVRELVTEIERRQPGDVIRTERRGPPTHHALVEYEAPLWHYRPGTNHHIICDRWHVGESVYPRVLRRRTTLDSAVYRHLDLFLQSRGALIVSVNASPETVFRRQRLREDEGTASPLDRRLVPHHALVSAYYEQTLRRDTTGVAVTHVDTSDDRSVNVNKIILIAAMLERRTVSLSDLVTYVGPPRPEVLIFGEIRGVSGSHATGLAPAFVPYPPTSGHFLLRHLNVTTPRVGLANACDVDAPIALYERLGRPSVVTLGKLASRRLHRLGVTHGAAPHPQWVRRFHHREGLRYADVICRVAQTGEDLSSWRP